MLLSLDTNSLAYQAAKNYLNDHTSIFPLLSHDIELLFPYFYTLPLRELWNMFFELGDTEDWCLSLIKLMWTIDWGLTASPPPLGKFRGQKGWLTNCSSGGLRKGF